MATFLGPLTTKFTPPASCLNITALYRNVSENKVKILDAPECFPTNYVASGYYSPGTACPAGYQAATQKDGIETTLNCCPNQFRYVDPWPGNCVYVEVSTTFAVYVTAPSDTLTSTQYYPDPTAEVGANPIQLRYKSTDIPSSTASPATISAPSSAAIADAPLASQESMSDNSGSGLTKGAKVTVGVVVLVVVLAVSLLGIFLFKRNRMRHLVHEPVDLSKSYSRAPLPVEAPTGEVGQALYEMSAAPSSEKHSNKFVSELDGGGDHEGRSLGVQDMYR